MPLLNTSQPPPHSPGDSAQPCCAAACWIAVLAAGSGLRERRLHVRHRSSLIRSGAARSCAAATRSQSRAARRAPARRPRRRRRSTPRRARRRPAPSPPAACRRPARAPTGVTYSASISTASSPTASSVKPMSGTANARMPRRARTGSRCAAKRSTDSMSSSYSLTHSMSSARVAASGTSSTSACARAGPSRRIIAWRSAIQPGGREVRLGGGAGRLVLDLELAMAEVREQLSAAASSSAALSPASSTRTVLTSQ